MPSSSARIEDGSGLVFDALLAGDLKLVGTCRDYRVDFGRKYQNMHPYTPHTGETDAVTAPTTNRLDTVLSDIYGVVGEDAVEIEGHQPDVSQ